MSISDAILRTLAEEPNRARAVTRTVPGVGVELRYEWSGELRQSQVYRNGEELAAAANAKREELIANGWAEVPKLAWGN